MLKDDRLECFDCGKMSHIYSSEHMSAGVSSDREMIVKAAWKYNGSECSYSVAWMQKLHQNMLKPHFKFASIAIGHQILTFVSLAQDKNTGCL